MSRKKGSSAPVDNTSNAIKEANEAAVRAAEVAKSAALEQQARSISAAKESIERIKVGTGKSASEYAQEAEQQYTTIVPRVRQEFESKLAAFNPEEQLRPYAASAQAGLRETAGAMGERVAGDVERFGGMIAGGTTAAGQELSRFSRQAAKQQAKAFRTFERSARGATELGSQTAYAMTRGLSNLYNPEYQQLMEGARSGAATRRSSLLDEIRAKSLYNV